MRITPSEIKAIAKKTLAARHAEMDPPSTHEKPAGYIKANLDAQSRNVREHLGPKAPSTFTHNPWGQGTAAKFQELAALRGVSSSIEWRDADKSFYANGERCGESVGGLYAWLDRQPGVKA